MANDRLLTEEESDGLDTAGLLQFQDAKTLRSVGEWLNAIVIETGLSHDLFAGIKSLQSGHLPEDEQSQYDET